MAIRGCLTWCQVPSLPSKLAWLCGFCCCGTELSAAGARSREPRTRANFCLHGLEAAGAPGWSTPAFTREEASAQRAPSLLPVVLSESELGAHRECCHDAIAGAMLTDAATHTGDRSLGEAR
jgi:hypothetical protein